MEISERHITKFYKSLADKYQRENAVLKAENRRLWDVGLECASEFLKYVTEQHEEITEAYSRDMQPLRKTFEALDPDNAISE